jgi:hypothetical protein
MGAEAAGRPLADWIRTNGTPVDSTMWSSPSGGIGWPTRRELYDLKPGPGLAPAS